MPPSAGSVQLEVVAKVDQALQRLAQLEAKVQGLGATLSGFVSKKIEIDVSTALTSIGSVSDKLRELKALAQSQGLIVVKADASQVISEVKRAEAAVEASLSSIKAKAERDPFAEIAKNAKIGFKTVEDELDKLDKATAATFERLKRDAAKNVFAGIGENAAKEAAALNAEFQKLERNFQAAVNRINTEARRVNFDPSSASAKRLAENVRIAGQDMLDFAFKASKSGAQAGGAFDRLAAAEKQATAALKEFAAVEDGASAPTKTLADRFGTLATAVQLFLASLVVQKIRDFFESAVEAAVKIDLLKTALTGLLGSPAKANEQLDFLRQTADELGLSFVTLVENFRKFAPAATAAGLSLQETDDVFKAVTISARALGLSTEETERALLAFQQILQKGKFQAEELTRQLGQLLPNAVGILGKELGKSNKEILELVKSGKLATEGVLALSAGLVDAFGPTAIGNAQAVASEIERFKNAIFDLKSGIGQQVLPALNELLQALQDTGKEGAGAFQTIGEAAGELVTVVARSVKGIRDVFTGNFRALGLEIGGVIGDLSEFILAPILNLADLIVVALHKVGAVTDETFEQAKERSIELRKAIEDIGDGYRGLADDARGLGDKFADSLTGANRRIEKEQKSLLDRLRAAQKQHEQALEEDDEKATKKQAAELKKRERNFESFFERLQRLADKPITAKLEVSDGSGGDALAKQTKVLTDFGQKIQDLHKQLADLLAQEKEFQGKAIINTEDLERAAELKIRIGDVRNELRILGEQKASGELAATLNDSAKAATKLADETEKAKDRVKAALDELIVRNDAFAESFTALPKKEREAVLAIISDFEQLNERFGVTQSDVQAFGNALLAVFQQSGAVSADFAQRLAQEFGAAGAAAGGAAAALRTLAAAQDEAAGSAERAATAQDALAAAAQQNNQAGLHPLTDTVISVDKATGNLVITNQNLADGFRATDQALQQVISFLQEHQQTTISEKQAQDEFGLSLETLGAKFRGAGLDVIQFKDKLSIVGGQADQAGGGFARVGDRIVEIGGKAKEAGAGLDEAGAKVEELGKKEVPPTTAESVAKVGKAGEDAAIGLDRAGKAADSAKAPLDSVASSADKLAKASVPQGFADGLVGIGAAAKAAAEPLQQAATGAERLAAGLKGIGSLSADGVGQLATAFQGLAAPLAAAAEPASQVGTAFTEISTALTSIGGAADAFSASLGTIADAATRIAGEGALERIGGQLDAVDKAAAAAAGDLEKAATSLERFSDQAEPIATATGQIGEAFETLDVKGTAAAFNELNTAAGKVAGSLDSGGAGAERLGGALGDGKKAADDFKTAVQGLGAEVRGPFRASLNEGIAGLKDLKVGAEDAGKAVDKLKGELVGLRTEAIPTVQTLLTLVVQLGQELLTAANNARELASETAKIKLP